MGEYRTGDRVIVNGSSRGVVSQLENDGKVKLVDLDEGGKWYRPATVKLYARVS